MGRANLENLINEVLGMVKAQQDEGKKLRRSKEVADVNKSWDDTETGQAYWKDIRGRTTAQQNNLAAMDLAKENNAGQLARQQLQQDFQNTQNERTYNLDLFKARSADNISRFNAQTLRKEADWKTSNPGNADQIKAATSVLADVNSLDEDKAIARDYITRSLTPQQQPAQAEVMPQQNIVPQAPQTPTKLPAPTDFRSFDKPDKPAANVVPQAGLRTPQKPAITMPTLPARQPAPAAQSMEFASDDALRKRKMAERNKIVEEQMFGPKKDKGFFSSLF